MESTYIWVVFGKLPTTLILSTALYICAKRIGPLIAAWSFSAFFVTLSVGATAFPSILGAMAGGIVSLFLILHFLSNQAKLWRSVIWPLACALISIIIVGRVACWLSGCCFGELSHLPWATQYTDELTINIYHAQRYGVLAEHGPLAVHPVQLYESLGSFALLMGFMLNKKRLGEVSSALLLLGSYLSLYAILNPLRAYLNTPSSLLMWWGLSKLQWTLFTLTIIAFLIALRHGKSPRLTLVNTLDPSKYNQFFRQYSVLNLSMLWALLVGIGSLSLYMGTPFSAQLSMIGLCLSTVALLESIALQNKLLNLKLALPNLLPSKYTPNLSLVFPLRSLLLLALLPLCLVPLTLRTIANPNHLGSLNSNKNWVYHMDEKSKKLVRIGRVEDFMSPLVGVGVEHGNHHPQDKGSLHDDLTGVKLSTQDPIRQSKAKAQKPRLSFTLGRSKININDEYEITESDYSCSGPDKITTYRNQQTRQFDVAVLAYDLPMFASGAKQRLLGSWYHEKVNGNRQIDYHDYTGYTDSVNRMEDNKVFLDQMHLALAYEFTNNYLKLGAGLRLTWGNANDQFTGADFEYSPEAINPDILMGFGYKYVFFESGTGPVWGAPGLANPFVGLGVYAPFSESFQLFGRFGNAFLGPEDINVGVGEVGVQTHYLRASLSFSENQLFGAKIGFIY